MYTHHLFEDHVYLISNQSVARNPMFSSLDMQVYFLKKMEHYLNPLSEIIAYCLNDNEFQLLVRLKSRSHFEEHFMSKKGNGDLDVLDVPESCYIFSQAMANLQVSFVKHFNWKYERSGTLMAQRYRRRLVESSEEMEVWIKRLNSGLKKNSYSKKWANDMMQSRLKITSDWGYGGEMVAEELRIKGLVNGKNINLVRSFSTLPPYRLPSTKNYFLKRIHRLYGPFAPPKN